MTAATEARGRHATRGEEQRQRDPRRDDGCLNQAAFSALVIAAALLSACGEVPDVEIVNPCRAAVTVETFAVSPDALPSEPTGAALVDAASSTTIADPFPSSPGLYSIRVNGDEVFGVSFASMENVGGSSPELFGVDADYRFAIPTSACA